MTADDGIVVVLWLLEQDFSVMYKQAAYQIGKYEIICEENDVLFSYDSTLSVAYFHFCIESQSFN